MRKNYALDMTCGPFFKKILIFSVPLMLTGLLQLAYNTADVVVVGRFVGKEALAAVGSTGSLINLFVNLFIGISMGSGVVVARHIGENNDKGVRECVHTSMLLSIFCGFFIGVLGFFTSGEMLKIMNAPDDVIDLATLYLKIYFLGSPGLMAYNFGAAIVRSTGDTKRPLYILTFSGLVNVALNLFFVIVLKFGVSGVAIPTIISQYLSALLIIIHLKRMNNACRLSFRSLRIHSAELRDILRIGLPAAYKLALLGVECRYTVHGQLLRLERDGGCRRRLELRRLYLHLHQCDIADDNDLRLAEYGREEVFKSRQGLSPLPADNACHRRRHGSARHGVRRLHSGAVLG